MQAYQLGELQNKVRSGPELYHEFLSVPALSMGLYELAAGSSDPQQPHSEDEVYYITNGQGMIRVGVEDQAVSAGTIVFVAAYVVHYFHTITEDLSILVFFAPAEGTLA